MAESTGTGTTSGSNTPAPVQPASKQYIRATSDDNALEPDALRGSEQVIKDAKVQDDEADRRKAINPDPPKAA